MSIQIRLSCVLIAVGAMIMLISIVRSKELRKAMPFVPERQRRYLHRYLMLHRGLMIFFFFGYLLILAAVAVRYSFSELILGLILVFGSIFVFTGIALQSRLLSEMQQTLQGILPICAKCKKIRVANGDYRDPEAWKAIETYISERTDVGFTHGYCPECYEDALKEINRT